MTQKDIQLFTKAQVAQRLSNEGVFVDLATLESFIQKWSIEAVFENKDGEEFFDKNACETLLSNIQNKKKPPSKKIEKNLNEIKWHAWKEVSGGLCSNKNTKEEMPKVEPKKAQEKPSHIATKKEPQKEIVAMEKEVPMAPVQDMIMDGLKSDNVFKLDISESTLDMVARAIAKKIVKQVNTVLSGGKELDQRLLVYEEKNSELMIKLNQMKEENQKLQEKLCTSQEDLGQYKKTVFGLYRLVDKKGKNK